MSYQMKIPEEMRQKYLERRRRDVEELAAALDGGNFEPFQRIGHQLKGNGATYGYDELGELGQKMESAGEEKDPRASGDCLRLLKQWLVEHGS